MRKVIIAILAFTFLGCGPAVRDKEVYGAEIDFMDAAATEQVENGIALINEACKCESVAGINGFVTEACQDLAQTIVVVRARMQYHTQFMRYLGGISKTRPPEEPPEVPDPNTVCPGVVEPPPLPESQDED